MRLPSLFASLVILVYESHDWALWSDLSLQWVYIYFLCIFYLRQRFRHDGGHFTIKKWGLNSKSELNENGIQITVVDNYHFLIIKRVKEREDVTFSSILFDRLQPNCVLLVILFFFVGFLSVSSASGLIWLHIWPDCYAGRQARCVPINSINV